MNSKRTAVDTLGHYLPLQLMTYIFGWILVFVFLGGLGVVVTNLPLTNDSREFLFVIGTIGLWRYGNGLFHFLRGITFLYLMFPYYRAKIRKMGEEAAPSHVYLMVTSFRIDALTTAKVYDSVIREAINCKWDTTIVCSIVEKSDETLIRQLWDKHNPPARVALKFVRIPGTGKRDGLAHGFRAISRALPDENAVVAVIDGDTMLDHGVVRKTAPYFKIFPNMGALTTNEVCEVEGGYFISEWHKLRFAQRHLNMCSMASVSRVLTLTGRMSVFRASVVTDPSFIEDVENDRLKHWRLGEFKFLTGDDKSSWYSLMRLGFDTWYVPDAMVKTIEHPPHKNFFKASRQLMFRWYGNSLRQNYRATKLGLKRLGITTMYVLYDQRISMWTSLLGLTAAIIAAFKYSLIYFLLYVLWIALTRTVITLMLLASGHRIGPAYPLVLYYNQIVGSVMKIYVYFRLDRQSWTRQKTTLSSSKSSYQKQFNKWSSRAMTFACSAVFMSIVFFLV